jgi:hypothetical protein
MVDVRLLPQLCDSALQGTGVRLDRERADLNVDPGLRRPRGTERRPHRRRRDGSHSSRPRFFYRDLLDGRSIGRDLAPRHHATSLNLDVQTIDRRIGGSPSGQREGDRRRFSRDWSNGRGGSDGYVKWRGWLAVAPSDSSDADIDGSYARFDQPDLASRRIRKIENPIGNVGTAVVHPHPYRLLRYRIAHIQNRSERKRPMRGGQQRWIEDLAVRRRPPREFFSVPARHSTESFRQRRRAGGPASMEGERHDEQTEKAPGQPC